jgi:hypothetical protein
VKLQFPKGIERLIVPDALMTQSLRQRVCGGVPGTAPAAPIGGFACSTIHSIFLLVRTGSTKVHVFPTTLEIVQGDCVMWQAKAIDDSGPAVIRMIDFFDTPAERIAAGKTLPLVPPNPEPLGLNICNADTPRCAMAVALVEGTYRYSATVFHEGVAKRVDPDLVVSCGSNCDSIY